MILRPEREGDINAIRTLTETAFRTAPHADGTEHLIIDRLRAAGYSAVVQPVRTDKGTLNRVRVGPVSTRAEADQLKARLASGFGAGMVVPHP